MILLIISLNWFTTIQIPNSRLLTTGTDFFKFRCQISGEACSKSAEKKNLDLFQFFRNDFSLLISLSLFLIPTVVAATGHGTTYCARARWRPYFELLIFFHTLLPIHMDAHVQISIVHGDNAKVRNC